MLNYIWLGLILLAVVIGGYSGNLKAVADRSFEMAKFAVVDTAFPLIGIMALWLGMMRIAERSGLVTLLAKALQPLMRRLFPEVPADHPAMGSMLLNIAANMFGLGNAATPLGLRAMRDLDSLNPHPGTATNAMCTFLAINTSSVQLIPVTAIAILAANRSFNPTAIVGSSLLATTCAAISAVAMAKFLARLPVFRVPPASPSPASVRVQEKSEEKQSDDPGKAPIQEAANLQPLQWWGKLILGSFVFFFLCLFVRLAFSTPVGVELTRQLVRQSTFIRILDAISKLAVPFLLCMFPLYGALRRVKVYEEFVEGAKEGFQVALRIIPYLVAILVAIGMFRAGGGIDLLSETLKPVLRAVGFPPDLLPLALMRPLSGSGSVGIFTELVKTFGADSFVARTAGTMYGSTETTFYVLAVYFGSVGIKKTRYALLAGLTADFVGIVASVIICRMMFR